MADAADGEEHRLTDKGRATRDRIVESAAHIIVNDGLAATTMEAVRQAAAVSGSQLTHYFADKNALIRAVVRRQLGVVLTFHRQPALRQLDSFDDFERWIELNMRYLRRIGLSGRTPTFHALTAQLAKSDDNVRQAIAAAYEQWIDVLAIAIGRMKADGLLIESAEPRDIASVVVAAHQGGATMTFSFRAEWPHADATRFAVNFLRTFATAPDDRQLQSARGPKKRRRIRKPVTESIRLTRKGLATQTRIVDAAAQLIFERGVGGTSLDQIRAAAQVSGSQISHYFRGKDDLTRRVVASRSDDVVAFHTQSHFGSLDSIPALRAWAAACIGDIDRVYLVGGCVFGSLAGELIDSDDETRNRVATGYDRWLDLFEAGLSAMRDRGELRPDADPRHLATSLVAAHQGGAMLTHVTGDGRLLRVAVSAAVDYVCAFASRELAHARKVFD